MKSFFLKRLFFLLFILPLILLVTALFTLQLPPVKSKIIHLIKKAIEKNDGVKLSYKGIEGFFPFSITLKGFEVYKDEQLIAKMEMFNISPSIFSFMKKEPIFRSINADQVLFYYTKKSANSPATFPAVPPILLTINSFNFSEVSLYKQTEGEDKPSLLNPIPLSFNGQLYLNPPSKNAFLSLKAYSNASPNKVTEFTFSADLEDEELKLSAKIAEPSQGLLLDLSKGENFEAFSASLNARSSLESWKNAILYRGQQKADLIEGEFSFSLTPDPIYSSPVHLAVFKDQLEGRGKLTFNQLGETSLNEINIHSKMFTLFGELSFDRSLTINRSELQGEANLQNLSHALSKKITGQVLASGKLSGKIYSPTINLKATSDKIEMNSHTLQNMTASTESIFDQDALKGHLLIQGDFNHSPTEIDAEYTLTKKYDLSISNIHLRLPKTKIKGDLDLHPPLGVINGQLSIDSEELSSLSHSLKIPLTGKLSGTLAFHPSPESLDRFLSQSGSFSFKLTKGKIGKIRSDNIAGKIHFTHLFDDPTLQLKGSALAGSIGEATFEEILLSTEINPKNDQWPFNVQYRGHFKTPLTVNCDGNWSLFEETFNFGLEQFEAEAFSHHFTLLHPTLLEITNDQVILSPLRLESQSLIDPTAPKGALFAELDKSDRSLHFNTTLNHFTLGFLHPLFPTLPFDGIATGQLFLSGSSDELVGSSKLQLKEVILLEKTFAEAPPLSGNLKAEYNRDTLSIEMNIGGIETHDLYLNGSIPANINLASNIYQLNREAPLNLQVKGKGELAPLMQLFVTDTTRIEGDTSLDFHITGSLNAPDLRGTAQVRDGGYESLFSGSKLEQIQISLEGEGDKVNIVELKVKDGRKGEVTGSGSIDLNPQLLFPYTVHLNINNTLILSQDFARATCSGKQTISGNLKEGKLEGTLHIDNALLSVPENFPKKIYSVDVTYINQESFEELPIIQQRKKVYPLTFDIAIESPSTTELKGQGIESKWEGSLKLLGSTGKPLLYGNLGLKDGSFKFAEKVFLLSEGEVRFNGDLVEESHGSLLAKLELTDLTVMIALKGKLKNLDIDFYSVPPLPEKDVLSYVLFNQPIGELSPGQGLQLANTLLSIREGAGPDILGKIGKGIGLDRIDINTQTKYLEPESGDDAEREKINEVNVKIGKYVSKDVYISINKAVNSDAKQIAVEAKLSKRFKLEGEIGTDSEAKLFLKWKKDY